MEKIPTYTPYLQLSHLLSLAWITYPVISLIIVVFRLHLSLEGVENGLDSVKRDLLSSCTAAERAATAAASLPRYMAETSNRQFADAANGVLTAAKSALILSLTIIEALINFVLAIFRSTLLCLLELAMSIGLSLVTDAVHELNSTIATIGNDLANEITSANDALSKAVVKINKIDPIFKIPVPSINGSDLQSLQNLTLPPTFQATLTTINSSMPSANQIKGAIENLVDTPFELLKHAINRTFNNLTFNPSIFPVPAENRLTFCNNLDTSSIDKFKTDLITIAKYGTYIIIGLIFIITGFNCLFIWYRWRSMQGHYERTREAWVSDPANGFSESSPPESSPPESSPPESSPPESSPSASSPIASPPSASNLWRSTQGHYGRTREAWVSDDPANGSSVSPPSVSASSPPASPPPASPPPVSSPPVSSPSASNLWRSTQGHYGRTREAWVSDPANESSVSSPSVSAYSPPASPPPASPPPVSSPPVFSPPASNLWRSTQGHYGRTREAWVSDPANGSSVSSPSVSASSPPASPPPTSSPPVFSPPVSSPPVYSPSASSPSASPPSASPPSASNLWRSMQGHYRRTREAWLSNPANGSSASSPPASTPSPPASPPPTSHRWHSKQGHYRRTREVGVSDPANGFSASSPSAPQLTHSNPNLMVPQPAFPSPSLSISNHNLPSASSPSAPQLTPSNPNLMTSQPAFPPPSLNLSNHNLPSASSPSAPQLAPSNPNLMMSQPSFPSPGLSLSNHDLPSASSPPAPQLTPSNPNFMMSQPTFPSPSLDSSDHNLLSVSSPSAPQLTPSNPNLNMSQPAFPSMSLSNHNLMMLQANSEHPLITRIVNLLAARTGMTPTQNVDMRWFFHYIFHPPALACFLLGFFGLLSVMIQLLLLGPLLAAARAGVEMAVKDISSVIVNAINKTMYDQSATYANGVNSKVDVVQSAINHGLFGWVNGTTSTLNKTINQFYGEVQTFVTHLFNGTILEDPASNFLKCVIGNKVADIGEALTFLQDNLVIDLPRVSKDVLVLSAKSVNEATDPIASGAVGSGANGDQGLLGDVVAVYQRSLMEEAILFGIFMGLWGIVLASAICVLLWRVHKRKKELEAAKLQRLKTELQVDLEHVRENNSSFPNDEKEDPFLVPSEVGSPHTEENKFSFPNDEKEDPFKFSVPSEVGLKHMKEDKFEFPNDEKEDPYKYLVPSEVGSEHIKENRFSFPNDEKEDPFLVPSEERVKENKFSFPYDEKKNPFMNLNSN